MNKTQWIFYILDFVYSLIILFPIIVLAWASTWSLYDLFVNPTTNVRLNHIICILIGSFLVILIYVLMPLLHELIPVDYKSPIHVAVSRTCMYVYALGILLIWHGVWELFQETIPRRMDVNLVVFTFAEVALGLLKCSSLTVGSPFLLLLDTMQDFYITPTRFNTNIRTPFLYVLDILATVTIITPLCITVWSSLWYFADQVLPSPKLTCYLTCLSIGYPLALLSFILLPWVNRGLQRLVEKGKALSAWGCHWGLNLGLTLVVVFLWKGLWGLLKDYVMINSSLAFGCHAAGFLLMFAHQIGSTLARGGIILDGNPLLFKTPPIRYFSVLRFHLQINNDEITSPLIVESV